MTENRAIVPANLLIVDDTPANLQVLSGMLKQRGHKVRPAPNGKLALIAAQGDPPDLVLLDITMPEMNGYEVCECLKANEKLKEIPVIFISALNETLDKVRAFSAGGVDYITKPFQFEEVEARVNTHLEIRRQKRLLQENYFNLQKLESLRDSLTHMVVHDMRSPLMAINGFIDLLAVDKASTISQVGQVFLENTKRSILGLLTMVNALLDVSKLEAGQMKLKREECNMVELAQQVVSSSQSLKGERQIQMESTEQTLLLDVDRELILRIIQNLLANAIKYTPARGTIRICIARLEESVRVAVSDSGLGIDPQHHQKIFEKFGQIEDNKSKVGTGLGLNFCKLAVEAHGGRIGVDSIPDNGSTFWFVIPPTNPREKLPGAS